LVVLLVVVVVEPLLSELSLVTAALPAGVSIVVLELDALGELGVVIVVDDCSEVVGGLGTTTVVFLSFDAVVDGGAVVVVVLLVLVAGRSQPASAAAAVRAANRGRSFIGPPWRIGKG
jgi:hypothetical protein